MEISASADVQESLIEDIQPAKPRRVFLAGAAGMLGSDVLVELQKRGCEVVAPTLEEFDMRIPAHLEHLRVRDFGNLDWVINCAAYTAVDQAESEFFEANQTNGIAPGVLAFICRKNDWRFMHISTDFVFDGSSTEPYTERHVTNPLGVYGQTKLLGEQNALKENPNSIICRTSWLYGPNGRSFPRTMIKAWLEGKDLRVVNDQIGCPTYTAGLARVMADFMEMDAPGGIYHTAGPDAMSWYDFAILALETYRENVLGESREIKIEPVPSTEYPTPAKRPKYSVLSFEKTAELGIMPMRSVPSALAEFCRRLPKKI